MVLLYVSVPFMILGGAIAVLPLVWGMRHQRSWEDGARTLGEEVVAAVKHSEAALTPLQLGESADACSPQERARLGAFLDRYRASRRDEELAKAS